MEIRVHRQEWSTKAEVYAIEGIYRGVELTGLTKKSSLAKKAIAGGYGSQQAKRQLAIDLKQQNGIYRIN
ncbi:MAG: hypothetical protein LBK58_08785 [Prevotellaceae bacterium]|jgi:hypothetical protein|nr:hypothetical protein [Prevotellaceae bacterium]